MLMPEGFKPTGTLLQRIYIPVFAIVKGGVQFPLNLFFRRVFCTLRITTEKVSAIFRIVNNDLMGCYNVNQNKPTGC